ncbi:MAG: acetyltransferase [Deferribacteraceae bacterium]|jgi:UDP-perosamine 4-acetyltransferase|nr:acetyltransferase [Deferribacteraceae bacterium]
MNKKYNAQSDVLLLGAGGHAKVIIETIQNYHNEFTIIGITEKDESKKHQKILGIPVIGTDDVLQELYDNGLRKIFISIGMIGNYRPRAYLYNLVKDIGFECINVIHGTSILSKHIVLGQGNAILAGVIINTEVKIGNNCIINTGSIIEHECSIGNNIHIAPGAKICGQVSIDDNCMIGVGANIIQGIHIGQNSIIGAGSVVTTDIPPNSIAVGVPAKIIRKR